MCLIAISYNTKVQTSKQSNITRGVALVLNEKIFFTCKFINKNKLIIYVWAFEQELQIY